MAFLALENLTKHFGSHVAVDQLTLGVEKGEFVSLLGPSGCGKTTTLQMIAGFVEPTGGAIRLEGRDLLAMKPSRRGLGIVFQSYALFPHMTVVENVSFGLEMQGVAAAERVRRVGETLELVGLAAFAGRFPRQLSGGQQQRVALARALVIRPQILLLDEPLSNLDAKLREEMQIELRQIQRTVGTTTILVTHDQGEAMALSRPHRGDEPRPAEQIGPPHEAYERPATPFVAGFLGKTNLVTGTTVRPERISFAAAASPARCRRASSRATTGSTRSRRRGPGHGDPPEQRRGRCRPRARHVRILVAWQGAMREKPRPICSACRRCCCSPAWSCPLAMTVILDFHDWGQYKGIEPVFILKNWREVFERSYYGEMFGRTFRIA
jgi:putative spermidine/putrescine transport system ATP-binding protein